MESVDKALQVREALEFLSDERQKRVLLRFFKTGAGEYGEGDNFLGVRVPQVRNVVKEAGLVPLEIVDSLVRDDFHEVRLAGLLLLVKSYEHDVKEENKLLRSSIKASEKSRAAIAEQVGALRMHRQELVDFYLANAERANNWDLVDLTSPRILGEWLVDGSVAEERKWSTLEGLVASGNLWRQRIAIVANWRVIRAKRFDFLEHYAVRLLGHTHDLMHKAVGWMLREVGKVSMEELTAFLRQHYSEMHRTTLRYAIEKMPPTEREEWLSGRAAEK